MMEGLKSFNCSTCLLNFGCVAAEHSCPHCDEFIEYMPDMYHKKVKCGNPSCKKPFGFMLFHATDRALSAALEQIRKDWEKSNSLEQTRSSRDERAARRAGEAPANMDEIAFAIRHRDECPRCGCRFSDRSDEEQFRHLRTCKDKAAHKAHAAKKRQAEAVAQKEEDTKNRQRDVMDSAMLSSGAGVPEKMWSCSLGALKMQCKQHGLPASGNEFALITKLIRKYPDKGDVAIPQNLFSYNEDMLSRMCAANRISLTKLKTREAKVAALEAKRGDAGMGAALLDEPNKRGPHAIQDGVLQEPSAEAKGSSGKAKGQAKSKAAAAKAKATAGKAKAKAKSKAAAGIAAPVAAAAAAAAAATLKAKAAGSLAKGKAKAKSKAGPASGSKRKKVS